MPAQGTDDEWVFFLRVLTHLVDDLQTWTAGIRSGKNLLTEEAPQPEFHQFLQEITSQTHRVHERLNMTLNESLERRQQKQEANSITSLIPSMVNEIRSYVVVIGGYADLLAQEESQREREHMGHAIIHKAKELQEYVDKLQAFLNRNRGGPAVGSPR